MSDYCGGPVAGAATGYCPPAGVMSAGAILVLFILLVIITRSFGY